MLKFRKVVKRNTKQVAGTKDRTEMPMKELVKI